MNYRKIALVSVYVILVLAFVAHASAQNARQAKPPAQPEDPNAKKRKELTTAITNATASIAKNCTSLKDAIISANAASSELPYDDNQIDDVQFEIDCQSGKLVWIAQRVFSSSDNDQTPYKLAVTADKAHQLGNTHALSDGLVLLISETASITVDDNGAPSKQVKWNFDLREEEYAQRFVLAVKDLASNLKKKIDAQTELNALPAPPAPPAPSPKGRRKK